MPIKYYSKNKNFYPLFIISNIGIILSLQFMVRYFIVLVVNVLFGLKFHKEQVLGSNQYDFESFYTYAALLIAILEGFFMIAAFVFTIEKANKILDYVLTNFFLEFIMIIIFTSFPTSFSFWIFSTIRISGITLLAEYIALKIEQKEITINSNFISGTI